MYVLDTIPNTDCDRWIRNTGSAPSVQQGHLSDETVGV
jgi:hypothetical protein